VPVNVVGSDCDRRSKASKPSPDFLRAPHSLEARLRRSGEPLSKRRTYDTKETDGMEIRTAVRGDLHALAHCEARAFDWTERPIEGDGAQSHFRLLSEIANGEIQVATQAGQVVGYISFTTIYDHLFISAIGVLPEHQRRGVGSKLLATAAQEATRRGLAHISLFTDGPAAHTLAFYRNRGFRETGRCEGPDFERIYLSKPLAPNAAAAA
jgi:ribosomal protein S18 acetylase RimI-like enzyme